MRYERISIKHGENQPKSATLDAYLLDHFEDNPYIDNRPAVIVCPGGGYSFVSPREGEPVAMCFLAEGFHAFVLDYSVAPARFPQALCELAEAVQMVREHAGEWHVAADQIYVLGFSAGGHLAASLGTLWNHPVLAQAMGVSAGEKLWKPDGMILCYPVITMGKHTHEGSLHNLLGETPPAEMVELLSLETQTGNDTVPAFLWHTADDGAVPVENSLQFAAALRRAGVSFELHVYQSGPHGLSLSDQRAASGPEHLVPDVAGWVDLAVRWVRRQAK